MKYLIMTLLFLGCNSNTELLLEPKIIFDFNFSKVAMNNWDRRTEIFNEIQNNKKSYDNLSVEDLNLIETYDETYESIWDVEGGGCSWYCGANYSVKSSNIGNKASDTTNNINLISDFSYKTAWTAKTKDGIGETFEYTFPYNHPRITNILVANGYVQSKVKWKKYSRVKKLKMYLNKEYFGTLLLRDSYALQDFELIKPLGIYDRNNNQNNEPWVLKFEIMEIYPGQNNLNPAITELFFDGIDVH